MKTIPLILTICLVIPSELLAADPTTPPKLGRLFLSPNDRATLDIIRQNSKAPEKVIAAENIEEDEAEITAKTISSNPVMVKGYIRRSDGKNTVWVNNQAMMEKTANKEFTVGRLQKNSGQVQITVNGTEKKTVALKPGQIYDPNSGQVYNHTRDVPQHQIEEEEPRSVAEEISKKLGLDNLKKKASDLVDLFSAQSESTSK